MSEELSAKTTIAPRELRDLVYRCCRVRGIDAANADRFAENLVHAEVTRGAALCGFIRILDPSPSSSDELARLAGAADIIEVAETAIQHHSAATATFETAVPLLALSHSLQQAAHRGTISVNISPSTDANQEVGYIEFVRGTLDYRTQTDVQQHHLRAYQQGLTVASFAFLQLERYAAAFRVAEATLDAISP